MTLCACGEPRQIGRCVTMAEQLDALGPTVSSSVEMLQLGMRCASFSSEDFTCVARAKGWQDALSCERVVREPPLARLEHTSWPVDADALAAQRRLQNCFDAHRSYR